MIDNCNPNPCESTATCANGIGSYKCVCAAGYTGVNCENALSSPCTAAPCLNGGTCASTNNVNYVCTCPTDYIGSRCQNKDPCLTAACLNGATCEALFEGADFLCNCPPYYQGQFCGASERVWTGSPDKVGCFATDEILEDASYYKKFTQPSPMSVTKCKNVLTAQVDPIYTMFTVSGANCYLSNTSSLNDTQYNMLTDIPCMKLCPSTLEQCGDGAKRAIVYTYDTVDADPDACDNKALCNADIGHGVCVDLPTASSGYMCKCDPAYTGTACETAKPDPCTSATCQNSGTCVSDTLLGTYTCKCSGQYCGTYCEYVLQCVTNPCQHGGSCVENYSGGYTCQCLQFYIGTHCENLDSCAYSDKCVNGTCQSVINGIVPGSTCSCMPGYTGVLCDEEIDYCIPGPCLNGATCHPKYMDYTCTCIFGAEGKNCETKIPYCVEYTADGVTYANRCVTRDTAAVCNNLFGSFTCTCTSKWTMEYCDLNSVIYAVLLAVYGTVNKAMIPMLEDLLSNPSQIKDLVPFIVGLQGDDNRTDLSWDYSDLFHWAAFEEKALVLERDLYKWNDVVLGNCFTFNHRMGSMDYKMRMPGIQGGLQALMRTQSDEYVPWVDTASILVFVHNKYEYVFSESVRYNAQPNGETMIQVRDTRYTRLAWKYGVCVNDPSEVKAYYYDGMYTTDGCLRSCYQDMIQKECDCMDPRYPIAPNATSCELVQRTCIDDATAKNGDAATWVTCVCPLPCANQQYSVEWHRITAVLQPVDCLSSSDVNCTLLSQDDVLITVTVPRLEYQVYEEVPNMDFNRFISNLGGLLGVLMGVCVLSFIEVAVLLFRVVGIALSKK